MPGARTVVADMCMFGLAACDEGGPGFANASVQGTNARQVECNAQARIDMLVLVRTRQARKWNELETWVHQVARAMGAQLREDKQDLKTREQKKAKDAKKTRGIVHKNVENKATSQVQDEMRKLMHHVEQELFSLSEGVFGMTTEAVGWTPSCAPRQDVRRWTTFVVTRCTRVRPDRRACVRRRKHPSRQDGRRLTRDNDCS